MTVQACPTQAWVQLAGFYLLVFPVPPVPWGLCWAWGESKGYKWMARGTMGLCASLGRGHGSLRGTGAWWSALGGVGGGGQVACLSWEEGPERGAGGGPWDPTEACALCCGFVRGRLSFGLAWGWLSVASVPSVPRARQDRKEGHAGTVGEGGDRCPVLVGPSCCLEGVRGSWGPERSHPQAGSSPIPRLLTQTSPPNLGF